MSCHIQELRTERICAGICLAQDLDVWLLRGLLWLRTKEEVM